MAQVNPDGQNILFAAFVMVWIGGVAVLGFPANVKGREYLRRLPPVDGAPLYMYYHTGWGWNNPSYRASRQRQSDPELERLRQEGLRAGRLVLLWMFGFPVLVAGILALLILSGLVRFTG